LIIPPFFPILGLQNEPMRVAIFSTHVFEKPFLERANSGKHEIVFHDVALSKDTACLAKGCDAVGLFSSDTANAEVLALLRADGVKYIALRSVGFDHVDLPYASVFNMKVANVPAYSPHAIAEHSVTLMMSLNRKVVVADHRIKRHDFSINGLIGFDMHGKTVGIVGTGNIGSVVVKILHGFGCKLLAYDLEEDAALVSNYDVRYTTLDDLCQQSDIISLYVPLNTHTTYLINENNIAMMKQGVMLINTARGGVVDTQAVLNGLYSGKIGAFGMDVYEHEKGVFFTDLSHETLQDKTLALLTTFSNVLITAHQAFLTNEALAGIAGTTIDNLDQWQRANHSENQLN
jgi:D-lactate dehydrogenase